MILFFLCLVSPIFDCTIWRNTQDQANFTVEIQVDLVNFSVKIHLWKVHLHVSHCKNYNSREPQKEKSGTLLLKLICININIQQQSGIPVR